MASVSTGRRQAVPIWMRAAFAVFVLLAIVAAAVLALSAEAPKDVPDWALNSVAVYRCEVLAAVFVGMYAPLAALYLAAQGRAFTKLTAGKASIEAEEIEKVEEATTANTEAMDKILVVLDVFKEKLIELDTRTSEMDLAAEPREAQEDVDDPGEEPTP